MPERPHDETWWERELIRNEKLMDKYMAALDENPDKFNHPRDLYNKVHFGIEPPEHSDEDDNIEEEELSEAEEKFEQMLDETDKAEAGLEEGAEDLDDEGIEVNEDKEDPFDNEPPDNEDYPAIAKMARAFAVKVMRFEDIPETAEVLYLSAGKVGANLAGGHGLGYNDDTICGNIVKCRWALADCEFCREMLGHLHERTGNAFFQELCREAQEVSSAIRERITRLRSRVWW